MTLRSLWLMARGRRRAMREHAVVQAGMILIEPFDVGEFLETGAINLLAARGGALKTDPDLERLVQERMRQIEKDGKLVVPEKENNGPQS